MAPNAQGPPRGPSPGWGRSKFLGVSWNGTTGRWTGNYTTPEGNRVQVGSFGEELHAAIAHDTAVLEAWGKVKGRRKMSFPWAMILAVNSAAVHQLLPEQLARFRKRAIEMGWIEATPEDAPDPDAPGDDARWTDPFLPEEDERKAREMHERGIPSGEELAREREARKEERIERRIEANRSNRTRPMPAEFTDAERKEARDDLDRIDRETGEGELTRPGRELTPEQRQKRKELAEQLTARRADKYEREKAAEQERIKKAVAARERREKKDEGTGA